MSHKLCVICGASDATTKDHIPPKNIFLKPRPNDLITVPACRKCNSGNSKHDEEFRVFLSFQIGIENKATKKLWKDGALPTLDHNDRLRNFLIENSREIDLHTPAGIFLGKRHAVAVPMRGHNAVLRRTVRGLYFHHFGTILGSHVSLRVVPIDNVPNEMGSIIAQMEFASIANGTFCYRYCKDAESPLRSMWLLMFYQSYLVLVETRQNSQPKA